MGEHAKIEKTLRKQMSMGLLAYDVM